MQHNVTSNTDDPRNSIDRLSTTVLDGGYCIGCGACNAVENSPLEVKLDESGRYTAVLSQMSGPLKAAPKVMQVCPFSEDAIDESTIGKRLFGTAPYHDHRVGHHISCYAGYVVEGDYRTRGSSGGVAKWILAELLRSGSVDSVVQVMTTSPGDSKGLVYRYDIMHSVDEVRAGSKSAYYPVEMSSVLKYIRETPGRYAITGVPCFIKAVRLLASCEPIFQERIVFTVGIICGHLKSTRYAEMLAWQLGIKPGDLGAIDFRSKLPGRRANDKGVEVRDLKRSSPAKEPAPVRDLFGGPYNLGFFQYRACDYCDDVVAETADISIGDAWLPEYVSDGRGSSVVIVRNKKLQVMIGKAIGEGRLCFDLITADRVVESQAGGFRQRREGLAYRLLLADQRGVWRPPKRVKASAAHLGKRRRKIYEMRSLLSEISHASYAKARSLGDFSVFKNEMQTKSDRFDALNRVPLPVRLKRTITKRLKRLIGWATTKANL